MKEDIRRTNKKLKVWERELEERKKSLGDQHSKVAKLKADLDKITDGMPHPQPSSSPPFTCFASSAAELSLMPPLECLIAYVLCPSCHVWNAVGQSKSSNDMCMYIAQHTGK